MAKDSSGNQYISENQVKGQKFWAAKQAAKSERLKGRQEARANRTDQEQLDRLDELLGKDIGAKKERARLKAKIEAAG